MPPFHSPSSKHDKTAFFRGWGTHWIFISRVKTKFFLKFSQMAIRCCIYSIFDLFYLYLYARQMPSFYGAPWGGSLTSNARPGNQMVENKTQISLTKKFLTFDRIFLQYNWKKIPRKPEINCPDIAGWIDDI